MTKTFYDATEVSEAAGSSMKEILTALFPNIQFQGGQGRIGSLSGEKGTSLAISIEPHKSGQYLDHHTGETGNIFTLIQEVKGYDFAKALHYIGENYTSCIKHEYNKEYITPPKTNFRDQCTGLSQQLLDYAQTTRKVSLKTLEKMKCVSSVTNQNAIGFPHFLNDHVVAIQFVDTSTKNFFAATGGSTGLVASCYASPLNTDGTLTVTEGPWDAASYIECAIPAVSIPNGVSNMKWLEIAWPYLAQFKQVVISFDMDAPGEKAAAAVIQRLGVSKCLVVKLPEKDASDMLQAGKKDELIQCWKDAQPTDVTDMIDAEELRQATKDMLTKDMSTLGDPFFLPNFNHRIRDHEMTLVFGQNFSGKSQFISNQIAFDAARGINSSLASFEQTNTMSMTSLMRQFTGIERIADHPLAFDEAFDRLAPYIRIYKKVEKPTPEHIIDQFTNEFKRKGTRRFYVDNLMTMKVDRGDNTAQAEAVNCFRLFTKQYPVHLFFLAHPRKPSKEYSGKPSDRNDIRGASELSDIPENIILVYRNESKDDTLTAMFDDNRDIKEIEMFKQNTPDGAIMVQKNRLLGTTPRINVWFNKQVQIFMEYYGQPLSMIVTAKNLKEDNDPF